MISTDLRRDFHMTETDYSQVVSIFLVAYAGRTPSRAISWTAWERAADFPCHFHLVVRRHAARVRHGKMVAGRLPVLTGIGRARQLAGGSTSGGGVVSSAIARVGDRNLQCRHDVGVGGRPAGGQLPDNSLRLALLVLLHGRIGFAWLAAWLVLYQPPHLNRWLRASEYEEMRHEVLTAEQATPAPQSGSPGGR